MGEEIDLLGAASIWNIPTDSTGGTQQGNSTSLGSLSPTANGSPASLFSGDSQAGSLPLSGQIAAESKTPTAVRRSPAKRARRERSQVAALQGSASNMVPANAVRRSSVCDKCLFDGSALVAKARQERQRAECLDGQLQKLKNACPDPRKGLLTDLRQKRWPQWTPEEGYPLDDHMGAGNCTICGWNHEHVYIFYLRQALYGPMRSSEARSQKWGVGSVYVCDLVKCASHPDVAALIPIIARRLNVPYCAPGEEANLAEDPLDLWSYSDGTNGDTALPGLLPKGASQVRLGLEQGIYNQSSTANYPQTVLGSLFQDKHVPETIQNLVSLAGLCVTRRRSRKQRKVVAQVRVSSMLESFCLV